MAPAVSVLLSVRDGLPYVREAIESFRSQTLLDWEMILVENGSSDDTPALLEDFARQDSRIKLVYNQDATSHSSGLNRGLQECSAPWVARMDADDRALPQRLERQLAFVAAQPDLLATSSLAFYIDAQGRRVGHTYHDLRERADFERYMTKNEAIGILHPGSLIRAETLRAVGGYRPAFDPANDIDLWARISERGLILVQQEYLMEYRVHGAAGQQLQYWTGRLKYEWSRRCSTARRSGQPEPTWDEFMAAWRGRPPLARLESWRKTTAKSMYRQAAYDWISRRRVDAARRAAFGCVLQPSYVLTRLRQQAMVLSSRGSAG